LKTQAPIGSAAASLLFYGALGGQGEAYGKLDSKMIIFYQP